MAGLFLVPTLCAEPSPARFTFLKVFPGSHPEYTALTIAEDGAATYDGRALNDPAEPQSFRLPAELVGPLFARVAELNYFQGIALEAPQKIANLGEKTFRYEKDGKLTEVRFNYTQNQAAARLQELAEKVARSRFYIAQLQFQLKFDRLAVLGTLREFEREFNRRGFVYVEQFVPVLTQVARDPRVVRLAQGRAKRLLERIQGAPAQFRFEQLTVQPPAYLAVTLTEDGRGTFESRRPDASSQPQPLEISGRLAGRLFGLVRQANYFRSLGEPPAEGKFRAGIRMTYEVGTESNQVVFVRPTSSELATLTRLLSNISNQLSFRTRLARAMGPEPVELPVVLQELEEAIAEGVVPDPGEFMPALEKVAQGEKFLAEEQALARKLLQKIRAAEGQ